MKYATSGLFVIKAARFEASNHSLNGGGPPPQQDHEAQDDCDADTQWKTKPKKGKKSGSRKTV